MSDQQTSDLGAAAMPPSPQLSDYVPPQVLTLQLRPAQAAQAAQATSNKHICFSKDAVSTDWFVVSRQGVLDAQLDDEWDKCTDLEEHRIKDGMTWNEKSCIKMLEFKKRCEDRAAEDKKLEDAAAEKNKHEDSIAESKKPEGLPAKESAEPKNSIEPAHPQEDFVKKSVTENGKEDPEVKFERLHKAMLTHLQQERNPRVRHDQYTKFLKQCARRGMGP